MSKAIRSPRLGTPKPARGRPPPRLKLAGDAAGDAAGDTYRRNDKTLLYGAAGAFASAALVGTAIWLYRGLGDTPATDGESETLLGKQPQDAENSAANDVSARGAGIPTKRAIKFEIPTEPRTPPSNQNVQIVLKEMNYNLLKGKIHSKEISFPDFLETLKEKIEASFPARKKVLYLLQDDGDIGVAFHDFWKWMVPNLDESRGAVNIGFGKLEKRLYSKIMAPEPYIDAVDAALCTALNAFFQPKDEKPKEVQEFLNSNNCGKIEYNQIYVTFTSANPERKKFLDALKAKIRQRFNLDHEDIVLVSPPN